MNGAQSLLKTLFDNGIDTCFTNPGTSEMHFVAAVDSVPELRAVLCLFEGVATGAADGYARMAGKPAATLLHLGPGLGNGVANLHNARRAQTPMVNVVGDHATYHLKYDAPLTSDIDAIASAVSGWVKSVPEAEAMPDITNEAVAAALKAPGQVATLVLPADTAWNASVPPAETAVIPPPTAAPEANIQNAATILQSGEPTLLLASGKALFGEGLRLLSQIAAATDAKLMSNRPSARLEAGAGRPTLTRLPYPIPVALDTLRPFANIILIGTKSPVAFFAYPNQPSSVVPEGTAVHTLVKAEQDVLGALRALAEAVGEPQKPYPVNVENRPALPTGKLTVTAVWQAVAALMPENAILVDESITSSAGQADALAGAPPFDWLFLPGGAIGIGLPLATGAAVACPDRKVICMEADGSGMYTIQALWTHAREQLDIVTVIFNNRAYAILQGELERVGAIADGKKAQSLLNLDNPEIDFVSIARGMGVPAHRATTADSFVRLLQTAMRNKGPALIEAMV